MSAPLLFIPIGGLGASQLEVLTGAVSQIPGVQIFRMTGMDQYRDDEREIWKALNISPDAPVYFAGHSLGGGTARNEANVAIRSGRRVAGLAVLDQVMYFDSYHSCLCPNTLTFQAENSFPFIISPVDGFHAVRVDGTNHNSLCQSPVVISAILAAIQAFLKGTPCASNPPSPPSASPLTP